MMRETKGIGPRIAATALATLLTAALASGGIAIAQDAEEGAQDEAPEGAQDGAAQDGAAQGVAPDGPTTAALPDGASTNRVAVSTAWSVFVEADPALECWGVSGPSETVNTRGGEEVEVRRGDILLFVAYRPSAEVEGEVSFTGGYPFAENSAVTLQIGADSFEMFTRGEFAWPVSSEDDARIVEAMKRGRDVTLTGRSARGTQTQDTFSLMGFTAALDEAQARCTP